MLKSTLILTFLLTFLANNSYSLSFPSLFPKKIVSQIEGQNRAAFLPPPMEGKYYKLETATGIMKVVIKNFLMDTTIVEDLEDFPQNETTSFLNGKSYTYDSNGVVKDTSDYTWNEATNEVTLINNDTAITLLYSATPNGMNLRMRDSTWNVPIDSTGLLPDAIASFENVNYIFIETSPPVALILRDHKGGSKITAQWGTSSVLLSWSGVDYSRTLRAFDLKGQVIQKHTISPYQTRLTIENTSRGSQYYLLNRLK